jgi:glycosyltransferase involved in cell wall biosynthesis
MYVGQPSGLQVALAAGGRWYGHLVHQAQRIVAIMTCHNRRDLTVESLSSFFAQDVIGAELSAVLVDDGSTDGTADEVERRFPECTVVRENGSRFWAAGMAIAEGHAMQHRPDFVLWLNDDVILDDSALRTLVDVAEDDDNTDDAIIVSGALLDPLTIAVSYGGLRRADWHPLRYNLVDPDGTAQDVDTVHGNVLLVPARTLARVGGIDGSFAHAYADFDYGLRVRKHGGRAVLAPVAVGTCAPNVAFAARLDSPRGPWARLRAVNTVKGRPLRSEVRYLRRHAGALWPVFVLLPYLKAFRGNAGRSTSRSVVMADGAVLGYRIPLYECLVRELYPTPFVLSVDEAAPGVATSLEAAGGRFVRLPVLRIARTWKHPQGFAEANSVVVWARLFRVLSRERPVAIISSELGVRTLQAATYKLLHKSVRLLVWARLSEHSERGRGRTRFRRALLRRADVVIVNGTSGKSYIQSLGVAPHRIAIVPQVSAVAAASEEEAHRRRRSGAGHTNLLFVGRLVQLKGVDVALRALATVKTDTTLRIVGDGPERASLEALARGLGVDAIFVGTVTDIAQLRDEFAAADYLVFPSLSDEWALVVVEALSQGTPVVGSNYAQAVTELVRDKENGFRAFPDSLEQFSAAVASACAASEQEWEAMSHAAWSSVALITPEAVAHRFAELVRGRDDLLHTTPAHLPAP